MLKRVLLVTELNEQNNFELLIRINVSEAGK